MQRYILKIKTKESDNENNEVFEIICENDSGSKLNFLYKRYGKSGAIGKITIIPIDSLTDEPSKLRKQKQKKGYEMYRYSNSVFTSFSGESNRVKSIEDALSSLFRSLARLPTYIEKMKTHVAPNIAQVIHQSLSMSLFYLDESRESNEESKEIKPSANYKEWGAWG